MKLSFQDTRTINSDLSRDLKCKTVLEYSIGSNTRCDTREEEKHVDFYNVFHPTSSYFVSHMV